MPRQLTPDHEAVLDRIVSTGRYGDADAVIGEALRLLESHDRRMDDLRAKIKVGIDELDRGEGADWTPDLMVLLSREADEMFRRGERPDPDVGP